jgi:hypothetical protein
MARIFHRYPEQRACLFGLPLCTSAIGEPAALDPCATHLQKSVPALKVIEIIVVPHTLSHTHTLTHTVSHALARTYAANPPLRHAFPKSVTSPPGAQSQAKPQMEIGRP